MKLPAFQFYPGDWMKDPQLGSASPASRGIWIDFIAVAVEMPERGVITRTISQFARLLRCSEGEFLTFLIEASRFGFADVQRNGQTSLLRHAVTPVDVESDAEVTVICRRMVRDEKARQSHANRQTRYRDKQASDAEVTPQVTPMSHSSSSSSSISSSNPEERICTIPAGMARVSGASPKPQRLSQKKRLEYPPEFEEAWTALPIRFGGNPKQAAYAAWRARRNGAVPAADLLEGAQRYAAFARTTGIIGSEKVQMGATFFGPKGFWQEPWSVGPRSVLSGNGAKSVIQMQMERVAELAALENSK